MQHQVNVAGELASAYQALWAPRSEVKVDNRAYAVASLGFWRDVARSESKPVFDLQVAPVQPALEAVAAGYRDLLA